MPETTLTWLGHATFPLRHAGRQAYLRRPVPAREPEVPGVRARAGADRHDRGHARARRPRRRHRRARARSTAATVVAPVELAGWLGKQGVENVLGSEQGRHGRVGGVKFTLTNAYPLELHTRRHYMGEPCGIVVEVENGTKLYFAGDTCVFGDMQLIGRIYSPDSRSSRSATTTRWARARRPSRSSCSASKRCVPCHWGTFPLLDRHARCAAGARARRARWSRSSRATR